MSDGNPVIDTEGEVVEEAVQITTFKLDVSSQVRRLKKIADLGDVDPTTVLRELYGTALPLIAHLADYVDRLEKHAEWASDEIDRLTEDMPTPEPESQLTGEDAEQYMAFLRDAIGDLDARLADADPAAEATAQLVDMKERATTLITKTHELTLVADDDDDDGGEGDDAVEDPPVPAEGAGNGEA